MNSPTTSQKSPPTPTSSAALVAPQTSVPLAEAASTLNIAAYHFVEIEQPQVWQVALKEKAQALQLKGTILLATEGINLFLAGAPQDIEAFEQYLQTDRQLLGLTIKRSWSAHQPFRKLIVKVKAEIIRMNHPAIKPRFDPDQPVRAPAVDARTLKRWLDAGVDDEGYPVVMLDTRNDFEVDYGTFDRAIDWRIQKFSDFPAAFQAHQNELAGKTVVSFCTGGIRCEKAAIFMRENAQAADIANVYQLDGGILQYFEDVYEAQNTTDALDVPSSVQVAHYNGGCFVFDQREALSADLKPMSLGDKSRFAKTE